MLLSNQRQHPSVRCGGKADFGPPATRRSKARPDAEDDDLRMIEEQETDRRAGRADFGPPDAIRRLGCIRHRF